MNNLKYNYHNKNMKIKYKINENELLINIKFLYNIIDKPYNFKKIINCINLILNENKINFKGNKIIIYINGILIGKIYLTNFYLKKIKFNNINQLLNDKNCFFQEVKVVEIKPQNKYIKTKKILSY